MSDERRAYTPGDAIYTKTDKRRALSKQSNPRAEARMGLLMAGGGMIWAAYAFRADYSALWQLGGAHIPGPLELAGLGILIWLHAKWRRSIQPR